MARPVKDPHERRTASLPPVRVTEAEKAAVEDQARAVRLPLSDFLRQRALTGDVVARMPAPAASLLVELSRAGNNLNQIARQLNSGGGVPNDLGQTLQQFRAVLDRVGRAHGA